MPQERDYNPTWQDVKEAMLHVAKERNVRLQVVMCLHETRTMPTVLAWRVEAHSWGKRPPDAPKCVKSDTWPLRAHKTVPGLLLRLLHEVEVSLEEDEKAVQAGLPF